ncbi:MAG: hypothetical protein CMA91_00995 [Euryarchaeota archaeon]|jgi:rRNA-processing protein FCF1|nr:hypothetical protein [Euryarchaeota archaeon]|tara:strand:- start:189 stop:545 length:357 start_codon:yes stop_codon:yes gene_type:complete
MIRVLIDACGWKAVMDAGINIDQALLETVGVTNLALLPNVLKELEAIGGNLMLDMLKAKSEMIESPEDVGNHTDDQLLHLSIENKWPILTVDSELKRRISQSNLNWLEVIGNKHLRLV